MPRPCHIIPLVERTPAWWDWRRGGIGSSDAATLLGEKRSPSAEQLFREKLHPRKESARSFEQARSATRERQARALYCRAAGVEVQPVCVQNLARPWQRASLDGLSADGERAVEIKCGRATYATTAARQRPARHHVPQLQHILAVTGLSAIDYWCHCPPHPPLRLEVRRDEAYIERLLAAEEAFWQRFAGTASVGAAINHGAGASNL
ncbi:lambda-exonuclease family protein [Horticoccus sp. 23ND18S-11]|uniref:lambda-exonuclease family protein n=1 Tax=Horticoccus sp. 23ND18S-11 TaxID=3391832 RepID=UPI0039C92B99